MPYWRSTGVRVWEPPVWLLRASVLWATLLAVPMCLFTHFDTVGWLTIRWAQPRETLAELGLLLVEYLVAMLLAGLVYFRLLFHGERAVANPGLLLWAYPLAAVILPVLAYCEVLLLCLVLEGGGLLLFAAFFFASWLASWWLSLAPFGVFAGLLLYVSLRPRSPARDSAEGRLEGAAAEEGPRMDGHRPAGERLLLAASTLWGALLGVGAFIFFRYPVYALQGKRASFWNPGVAVAVLVTGLLAAIYFHLFLRLRDRSLRPWAYPLASSWLAAALLAASPVLWYAGGYHFQVGDGLAFSEGTIQLLMLRGELVLLGLLAFGLLTGASLGGGLRLVPGFTREVSSEGGCSG